MNRVKILITGSGGFIYSNFVRYLTYEHKNKYEVIGLDKCIKSSVLNNIYYNKSNQFYIADICDQHVLDRIFELTRPEIVIHAAAHTFVDDSLQNPSQHMLTNVVGTQNVINSSFKFGVKKFIYISTDEVYGALNETDPSWTEESPLNPKNPYSASKASAELAVKAAHNSFGLDYIITRCCNNYGPRQDKEKLIPKVVDAILNDKKIPVYGLGNQIRDWLYVNDNCSALECIIDKGELNSVYNISANQEFTNMDVISSICSTMSQGFNLISYVEDRPGHDFRYSVDSTKLKDLGWEPSVKFKDGIKKTVNWYLANKWWFK